MDDQEQQQMFEQLKKHFERMGTTFTTATGKLDEYNAEIAKGKRSILTMGPALKNMKDALDDQRDAIKSGTGTEEDREKATKAVNKAQIAYEKTMKDFVGAQVMKGLADTLVNGGKAFLLGSQDMAFAGIRSMQAGGDSIAAASELFALEMERNANMIKAPLAAVAAAGAEIPLKLGIAAELAGKAGMALVDASVRLTKEGINALNTELTKTKMSFVSMSNAGAFFAGGMSEMRNNAATAGLRLDDYTKAVQNSANSLRLFGASQADAMSLVGKVTNTMGTEVNTQLRKLGFSQMEIAEGTADYMAMLARTGNLAGKSQGQLAQESAGYLSNLKLISAITGEDAKAAKKRSQDAAMQSAVQAQLASMGAGATDKFRALVEQAGPGLTDVITQLQLTGSTTNAAAEQSGVADIIRAQLANLKNENVTTEQSIVNFANALNASKLQLQAYTTDVRGANIGAAFRVNSQFAQDVQGITNLLPLAERSGSEVLATLNKQKNTSDAVTNETVRLQKQFEAASIALEKELTPSLKGFATQLQDTFKSTQKYIETALKLMVTKDGARTTTPDADTKQPVLTENETLDAYGKAYGFAEGGVITGPTSGYKPNIVMHGTEAIVPLKGGGVPVESPELKQVIEALKGISSTAGANTNTNTTATSSAGIAINLAPLIEKMAENNQLLRNQLEMNRQIADKLETGNSNTKGLLSYAR